MSSAFKPGDLVSQYALKRDWRIARCTVFVEGVSDLRYFELADSLYSKKSGLCLISDEFRVVPIGLGDEGGTRGLLREFHPMRSIMDIDVTAEGSRCFYSIALFDDDMAGRRAFDAISAQHMNYKKWRDVFLLKRILPRTTRSSVHLEKSVVEHNNQWKGLDCEIEDLVSPTLAQLFLEDVPNALKKPIIEKDGGFHYEFTWDGKDQFLKYVERNAADDDLGMIAEVLKSLRYAVGADPEGTPIGVIV